MNPVAEKLNQRISECSPVLYSMLSQLGQDIFFPKTGILSQSADADRDAYKYNATIGIATENKEPMHLKCMEQYFQGLSVKEIFSYAPPAGRAKLRTLWRERLIKQNPKLSGKSFSMPVVTSALTHGLSLFADLFIERGDTLILPDKLWGNYRLLFESRKGAKFSTYSMFNDKGGFNCEAFKTKLEEESEKRDKITILLNFPNNPTGYAPLESEVEQIKNIILNQAKQGTKILVLSDDAYFSLFFSDSSKESIFSSLCDLHENIVAIKLDGPTKELFSWGFRVGFITFNTRSNSADELYLLLEDKVKGLIRGGISNCNHASQAIVEKTLEDPELDKQLAEKFETLKERALFLKTLLDREGYQQYWSYYPYNSGYFMCLQLKTVNAEALRIHLLKKYGIGVIAIGASDIRIAFSCIEKNQLEDLINSIFKATSDLS